MFGWAVDRMTIRRSVPRVGKEIEFGIDPKEHAMGETAGTGIPIRGIKMRGKELRVFVQLKKFKRFLLVTDGDTNLLQRLGRKVKVIAQRWLWHLPHQVK